MTERSLGIRRACPAKSLQGKKEETQKVFLFEYWEIRWIGPDKEPVRVDLNGSAGEPLWIAGAHTIKDRETAKQYWKKYGRGNKYYRLIHVKRYKTIK